MGHEFELRKEITLAASPEQVWDAIATGPGMDAWFMGRNEIEPAGDVRVDADPGDACLLSAALARFPSRSGIGRHELDDDAHDLG